MPFQKLIHVLFVVKRKGPNIKLRISTSLFLTRNKPLRSKAGSITEFGPAIFVLFIVVLFPLVNLIGLTYGVTTVFLIAHQSASRAGASANYSQALVSAVNQAQELAQSRFGKLAKLAPVNGYAGSGVDLYTCETNINTGDVRVCGPNELPPSPVDPSSNVYQYLVRVTYDVGPFVDLPFFGEIPGVGKPAGFSYGATTTVEHPDSIVVDDGSTFWIQGGKNGLSKGSWRAVESGRSVTGDSGSFRR